MPSLNGFKDRIQSVAKLLGTAALSASIPGGAALLNPALRKSVMNDLFNAQATKAAGYLTAVKNELAQPDLQSISLNRPTKVPIPEITAEPSTSFVQTLDPAVDYMERTTADFYKALNKYDTAVDDVMSVENDIKTLGDDYKKQKEANPTNDLDKVTEQKYDDLEAKQLNNVKEAESAATQVEGLGEKLSMAMDAVKLVVALETGDVASAATSAQGLMKGANKGNGGSPSLSSSQLSGVHSITKNLNGFNSAVSMDLARGSSAKQVVDGLKSASSIKLGISSITGNKASKKEESNKKPEENASEAMEKGNRARKNLSMKLRPKGA